MRPLACPDDVPTLVARAQDGDVRAFETLLSGHLGQLRRFARAYTANPADADDLTQEALVKVYRSLKQFHFQSAFSSWLFAVTRNAFLDRLKSRASLEGARQEALKPSHLEVEDQSPPLDEQLFAGEDKARVWAALRQVPVEFRSALVLFDIEGCSYDEVATIENVAVGTVKSRLSRGRAHLRRLLTPVDEKSPSPEARQTSAPARAGKTSPEGSR